jgi:leucyl-tRNA synthetase
VSDEPADDATRRLLHRTIDRVRNDMETMSNNTAIARLIELNNHVVKLGTTHREVAEAMVLMVAPLAPHLAEELWSRLGHDTTLAYEPFPKPDPALLAVESVTCVLQVAGKVRDRIEVAPDVTEEELRERALASEAVQRALDGRPVRTVVVRAPRLANVVPA